MTNPNLQHDRDPLLNLSYYVSRCLVCGHVDRLAVRGESVTGWVACTCGHVYEVPNRTRWH